jgi:TolB-like protein/Tfp pilus assembly protein PilF
MPQSTNKISQFWNELKRRSVLRSLAIYAGSAFVILEAATIIFPRWGLPDWSIDLVLYLIILGAVITLVVAWIFDITPEGVQKTKPADEIGDSNKSKESNAWKVATYISLLVIVAFIIFNVVPFNKHARAGTFESLVILPFYNFTGSDDFEYLVSGIHSSLITDMGQLGGLRVRGKTTANSFKDTDMSLTEIASELNVDAVVEGSISCVDEDSVCVQIQLISVLEEEQQLWVQDYRVAKSQFLSFYNNVTKQISEEINIVLTPREENLLAEARSVDPEAYDAYLMGQFYWEKLDKESMEKALDYFELAIELEPDWADPYAGLANAWGMLGEAFFFPKSVTLPKKYKYLNKALELDPNSAQAHYVKATNAVWTEWDWEKGEIAFLKSLELNPNNALCRLSYADLLMILRRSDEAVQQANLGLELDPLRPLVLILFGVVMSNEGNIQSAILHFEKALSIDPNYGFAKSVLANSHMYAAYENGDYEKWIESWEKKVKGFGHWNDEGTATVIKVFHEKGHIAAIEEMFKMNEKYGNDCWMSGGIKAARYLKLREYDKAMDCLEKDYEMGDMSIAYIATDENLYDQLKDNPRFIELLKKMNLPLPNSEPISTH